MYKHILIATDGSQLATKGVTHGLELARSMGATTTIATVTESWSGLAMARAARAGVPNPVAVFEQAARDEAREVLEAAVGLAKGVGMNAETLHITDQHPAEGILQAAREKGCDLIVMASHGRRGAQRLLLGSQTAEVVSGSSVPVLVVR